MERGAVLLGVGWRRGPHGARVRDGGLNVGQITDDRGIAVEHKRDFLRSLTQVATEAGVPNPNLVARQLSILFDGVSSQTVVNGRGDSAAAARAAAAALIS